MVAGTLRIYTGVHPATADMPADEGKCIAVMEVVPSITCAGSLFRVQIVDDWAYIYDSTYMYRRRIGPVAHQYFTQPLLHKELFDVLVRALLNNTREEAFIEADKKHAGVYFAVFKQTGSIDRAMEAYLVTKELSQ